MVEEREQARRRRPDIMVLFMSDDSDIANHLRTELDDGIELLNKPFSKSELVQIMRSALDSGIYA